jgi:hypothetical protein
VAIPVAKKMHPTFSSANGAFAQPDADKRSLILKMKNGDDPKRKEPPRSEAVALAPTHRQQG